MELVTELVDRARDLEDPDAPPLVITALMHPPSRTADADLDRGK
jgi:hypothetical protein